MATYRILSLDGGGLRGLLTSTLLERIVEQFPSFLESVDLIAGTSTGAILALALAKGLKPKDISDLYRDKGPSIFQHTLFSDFEHGFGVVGAKYGTNPREDALQAVFGETKLEDLQKKVLVASVDLDSAIGPCSNPHFMPQWKAKIFHNFEGPGSDGGEYAVDVAMRSSAAPVYFPIYQGFVDGGLVANNPSMCALCQALHPEGAGRPMAEISLLSIGTGITQEVITSLDGTWGLLQWAPSLVSLMMGASEGLPDYQCGLLLGSRYQRIQPHLQAAIGLDDVKSLPVLEQAAKDYDLADTARWITSNW